MSNKQVRTRFAPSPTGFMHIGNLRTALYEYLTAKSAGGKFILRIEDTDRGRLVEGSVDVIFETMRSVGIVHDEGPDIGGDFGPYIQSERKEIYKEYAFKLLESGKAYRCFCSKAKTENDESFSGYDRSCRYLSDEDIASNLSQGKQFAIRQKMPLDGVTVFNDSVYGRIEVENKELEDQILLKSDGFPTYNFANVVDDHLMNITHVVRGSEYLSSTPKYNLLYDAFGWEIPEYIHLPLIMGKNEDGTVSKLSKRHGSTSFKDLIDEGYLSEAIINYIALLGWSPKGNEEIMTMDELISKFSVSGISKSPAIFDFEKLKWFNSEYFKKMTADEFYDIIRPSLERIDTNSSLKLKAISELVRSRISRLSEVDEMISFFGKLPAYDTDLFVHKRMKTTKEDSLDQLKKIIPLLEELVDWNLDKIHDLLISYAAENEIKNGQIMWPIRTALSGKPTSPGGAVELLFILGKNESISRIKTGISLLGNEINNI